MGCSSDNIEDRTQTNQINTKKEIENVTFKIEPQKLVPVKQFSFSIIAVITEEKVRKIFVQPDPQKTVAEKENSSSGNQEEAEKPEKPEEEELEQSEQPEQPEEEEEPQEPKEPEEDEEIIRQPKDFPFRVSY